MIIITITDKPKQPVHFESLDELKRHADSLKVKEQSADWYEAYKRVKMYHKTLKPRP